MKKPPLTEHLVMTKGVAATIEEDSLFATDIANALTRYHGFDWGDTHPDDKAMNDHAVECGNERILAKYKTCRGEIFINTEADRSVTTAMFTHEY